MADPNQPDVTVDAADFITHLVAASEGIILKVPSNIPLAGIMTPIVLLVRAPDGSHSTLTVTASVDGSYAWRSTLVSDFPLDGTYKIQLGIEEEAGPPPAYKRGEMQDLTVYPAV